MTHKHSQSEKATLTLTVTQVDSEVQLCMLFSSYVSNLVQNYKILM